MRSVHEKMIDAAGIIADPTQREEVLHVSERLAQLKDKIRSALHMAPTTLERAERGEQALEQFITENKRPYNLLCLDSQLPKEDLGERLLMLGMVYRAFKSASLEERNQLEVIFNDMFEIRKITPEATQYLTEVQARPDTRQSQGAENINLMFTESDGKEHVLKLTKDRHEKDFSSVLKLMYDMHAAALRFNHETTENNIEINFSFKDMTVYKDSDGGYRRLVRQDFAEGCTIKDLPNETKQHDPQFRAAWRVFLQKVESMRESDGIVLDISDSAAGFKKERGNIAHTGNVFVRPPTTDSPHYLFTIIDPDVFDVDPGEHKFDPKEHLRAHKKFGVLASALAATKTWAINQARERVVRPWQDAFTKKELDG